MSKFNVDYDTLVDDEKMVVQNTGVKTIDDADRYITNKMLTESAIEDARVVKPDIQTSIGTSLEQYVFSVFSIASFENYGKHVIRMSDSLASDLSITDCTVPICSLTRPYESYYISLNKGIISDSVDGIYVTFTAGNIIFFYVDTEKRSGKVCSNTGRNLCLNKIVEYFGEMKDVDFSCTLILERMMSNSEMFEQTCGYAVIKTHGMENMSDAVDFFVDFTSRKAIENNKAVIDEVEKSKHKLVVNDETVKRELTSVPLSNVELIRKIINVAVNACVYITSCSEDVEKVHEIKKTTQPKTKKGIKKALRSGYSGSYMLVGKKYSPSATVVNSCMARSIVGGWVRGHWRSQPHGPKNSLRKNIFIKPFQKGVDDGKVHIHKVV